jgi:hypothetical protein
VTEFFALVQRRSPERLTLADITKRGDECRRYVVWQGPKGIAPEHENQGSSHATSG